jgi:hypothetical protein
LLAGPVENNLNGGQQVVRFRLALPAVTGVHINDILGSHPERSLHLFSDLGLNSLDLILFGHNTDLGEEL